MPPVIGPFPWGDLRPASEAASRAAAWADAVAWPDGGVLGQIAWRRAEVVEAAELARRANEPSAMRLGVRRGGDEAVVILPWALWRALAIAILGDDGELAAPRPPRIAERGFAAVAIADALARAGIAGEVELGGALPPWPRVLLGELAVGAPVAAELVVALPATLPSPDPRPLAALCAARGGRLPDVRARLELARGRVAAATLADLRRGDVLVVGPPDAHLAIARGRIAVALDPRGDGLTLRTAYQRASIMSDDLARDLSIPLAIVAGDVSLSARALLELAPGQVLPLGRRVGTAVEVRAGERCLARGELVTVDGELGVRVTELVDPAPAVVATPG